jgi:hypothetical protein
MSRIGMEVALGGAGWCPCVWARCAEQEDLMRVGEENP